MRRARPAGSRSTAASLTDADPAAGVRQRRAAAGPSAPAYAARGGLRRRRSRACPGRRTSRCARPGPRTPRTIARVQAGHLADGVPRAAARRRCWTTGTSRRPPPAWRAAVAAPPTPGHGVLVALERRRTVVGFAAFGPAELDRRRAAATRPGRRPRSPRCWSSRAGDGAATAAGCSPRSPTSPRPTGAGAAAGVAARGRRGHRRGFFESAGWAPDGWARTLDTGGAPLREVRWHALLDRTTPTGSTGGAQ